MATILKRELEPERWHSFFFHTFTKIGKFHRLIPVPKVCRLPEEIEETPVELQLQMEASQGERVVKKLSSRFLKRNHSKYMAITYEGKILAMGRTLEGLNGKLLNIEIEEDYYVCRIGFPALGRTE